MPKKYTKEFLQEAVNKCQSRRKLLYLLGLKETGGNYKNIKDRIEEFNIDTSCWSNVQKLQGWSKGLTKANNKLKCGKYTEKDLFSKNSKVTTQAVRNYLENDSNFEHKCQICNNTTWRGQKIALDLDHIDGNNRNNLKENLRFICPNCHAQTHTYRGRNIDKNKTKVDDNTFIEILKKSPNVRRALLNLGLTPKGGNYERAYRLIYTNKILHLF